MKIGCISICFCCFYFKIDCVTFNKLSHTAQKKQANLPSLQINVSTIGTKSFYCFKCFKLSNWDANNLLPKLNVNYVCLSEKYRWYIRSTVRSSFAFAPQHPQKHLQKKVPKFAEYMHNNVIDSFAIYWRQTSFIMVLYAFFLWTCLWTFCVFLVRIWFYCLIHGACRNVPFAGILEIVVEYEENETCFCWLIFTWPTDLCVYKVLSANAGEFIAGSRWYRKKVWIYWRFIPTLYLCK